MLFDEPFLEQALCFRRVFEGNFGGYSYEALCFFIRQLLDRHKEGRFLDMYKVVKVPRDVYLANSRSLSRGSIRAQRQVRLGLEMRHVGDIVGREELGLLAVGSSIAQAIGEDLRQPQPRWAVFVVVPFVELVEREAWPRLHRDVEVAGGSHCGVVFALLELIPL